MKSEEIESILKTWKTNRQRYLSVWEEYSLEQLNKIPQGFNNNLIWNIGHVIVSQQALIYRLSGLEGYVSDELFARFKSGTTPYGKVTRDEVTELKGLLTTLVDKTIEDLDRGLFNTYKGYTTSTGFPLESLTDALEFNNYHEGLHLGYIMSIRKFV